MRTRGSAPGRLSTVAVCLTVSWLALAGVFLVVAQSAHAVGARAFTYDFGITDNVFADPSGPVTVGHPIPVNVVIIDNDPSCVGPAYASCVEPTGTVTIFAKDAASNVTTLGSSSLTSVASQPGRAAQAVFSFPETLPAGDYIVYGSYSGDSTFAASSGIGFVVLSVNQATPTVTLTQSSTSSVIGQPVTFHAAVSFPNTASPGDPPQPAAPTGTITLNAASGTLATATPDANGDATLTVPAPAAAEVLTVHAEYSGDANLLSARSSDLVHDVTTAASTTPPTSAGSASTTPTSTTSASATPGSDTSTTSTGTDSGDLAVTGTNTAAQAGLGIGLLIVGAGVLLFTRPRSSRHRS
jgi:hypothetical protein